MPDDIRVIGDDIVNKFLLLSNSHDGTSSVQVKFTPIRVVCENTLTMALSRGRTVRVAYTRNLRVRLRQAEDLLGIIRARFSDIETTFTNMATIQVGGDRLKEYLKLVFPDPANPENQTAKRVATAHRLRAEYFFAEGKGNRRNGVRGTLWAAYNGVTEMVDYRKTKQSDERRLGSIWFGKGYMIKARAYDIAEKKLTARQN